MSQVYLDGVPHEQLVHIREMGWPFSDQDDGYVGMDYQDATGGGMGNVRLTREQATALRDGLHAFLTRNVSVIIARTPDGKLRYEEKS